MSIRVTTSQEVKTQYPKICENKHTGSLFLLVNNSTGTCIKAGSGKAKLGDFSESWTGDLVTYKGSVTLSQE